MISKAACCGLANRLESETTKEMALHRARLQKLAAAHVCIISLTPMHRSLLGYIVMDTPISSVFSISRKAVSKHRLLASLDREEKKLLHQHANGFILQMNQT